jgi:type IV secretion system protein TrbL
MAEKECEVWNVLCWGSQGASDVVAGVADDAINNLAKAIVEGMSQMVTTLSTFWVKMPTANLTTVDGMTPSPVVSFLASELSYWTLVLAVLSVILGGTRMIWEQRGAPLKDLLRSLLTLTLVSGLGLGVISILVIAADAFSAAIINRSTDGKGFANAMSTLVPMNQTGIGVFILIILGLVGLIASLVQIVLMVVRTGMLVILAGILPTTAAFTNTEMGRQWFQKAVGWTIAFILYKPAAAVVYAAAFKLMDSGTGKDALVGSITGFTLMIVAVLALPALMRFVTPLVGAVAAGSGGGAAAGAAMGAVATGAVSIGRSGSGRGNASPTPASQAPTSPGTGEKGNTGASRTGQRGNAGGNAKPTPGGSAQSGSRGPAASPAAGISGVGGSSGAVAGPVGLAASKGVKLATRAGDAAQKTAQDSTGEGPSGSN